MPLPKLPDRASDSNKGDFGRALLIGGSLGMTGAISLAGMAALRSGAGLVKLAVPDVSLPIVAAIEPSYMTVALPTDSQGRISLAARDPIAELSASSTAIACGPGLGRSPELVELVGWCYQNINQPLILDADALNALAAQPAALASAGGPRIFTPHPGEFLRLLAREKRLTPAERVPLAEEFSRRTGAVVVLKGHGTVITDGKQTQINTTGNAGMATGGTGDVLTGIITALVCQGLSAFDAAHLGAHVHGLAGDLATAELGQVGMIASDLIKYLPPAFRQI